MHCQVQAFTHSTFCTASYLDEEIVQIWGKTALICSLFLRPVTLIVCVRIVGHRPGDMDVLIADTSKMNSNVTLKCPLPSFSYCNKTKSL